MKNYKIILIGIFSGIVILSLMLYLFIIPMAASNSKIIDFICNKISQSSNFEVKIENPSLKTYLNTNLRIEASKIEINKEDESLLLLNNFKSGFSLKGILKKKLYVNNFNIDYIYANIDKLLSLCPEEETQKESRPIDWTLDLYDSILSLNDGLIIYSPAKDTTLTLKPQNISIDNTQKNERFVHFDINSEIKKNKDKLSFAIKDNNKVVIKNKHLYVNDCIFNINKSSMHINAEASRKKGLNVNLSSKKFNIEDVTDIIETNLVIPNGSEILAYFKDIKGNFDFDINMTKDDLNGNITLNNAEMKLVPINDMPLKVNKGTINITPKDIALKDFEGYYGTNSLNKAALEGVVKDYTKSCDTEINITTTANNEFAKDYLSAVAGIPLEIVGKAGTKIVVKSVYDKIDITVMSKLAKGDDILVDGTSLTPTTYDRAVKADMHIRENLLNIENINYYIASEIKKGVKIKPVVTLRGQLDISKPVPDIRAFGFEVPNPLPSEFLNVLIGQKLFKGGKFDGKLYYVNMDGKPSIKGKIKSTDIRIPSQRLFVQKADLYTDSDTIHIVSNGRYKRSNFVFTGDIKSAVQYPIVIKNLDFELDKLNVEKLLESLSQQPETNTVIDNTLSEEDEDDDSVTFDFNNLIIEKCLFKLKEGSYKDINFGNLAANLTLNKDNVLELQSNKFDIAEGISTIRVLCDLRKHSYYLRLGIKEVNSDLISSTLLNLPREISGKASGLIELNTDDSFKLNGQVKFAIKDGQIQKIGLVEYLMKFAALFRNPVVMISPSLLGDIINIPDGYFEKINGELDIENNFVKLLKIKSSSPQLSSYIIGCYNLENGDAILRIYTKFSNKNKGTAGFLRNFSLNSLANRIPLGSRNDINYYSAELKHLPEIDADEKDCQIFLTTVDGDLEHNNFLSSLKKIK